MKHKTKSFRKSKKNSAKKFSKKARKTRKMVGGFNPTFLVTVLLFCSLLFHYYHLYDKNERFIGSVDRLIKYSQNDGTILFKSNLEMQEMTNDQQFLAFLSNISLRPVALNKQRLSIADVASGLNEGEGNGPMIPSNTMILKDFKEDVMKLPLKTRENIKTKFLKACGEFFGTHPHIYKELYKISLPENPTLANILNRIATAFGIGGTPGLQNQLR